MITFLIVIYFLNIFLVFNLLFNVHYKLSYINYTLLFLLAFPIFTPIIYLLIYLDESIEHQCPLDYDTVELVGKEEIFNNGETFFDDLIKEIDQAKSFILINMFIFNTDQIGKKIIRKLEEKQKMGIQVFIVYDAFARLKMKMKYFKALKKSGGKMIKLMPVWIKHRYLNINYRNHRKLIVIDYMIAYLGGFNIGDEYISRDKQLGIWSDIELKIKGDMSSLVDLVNRDLKIVKKNLSIPSSKIPDFSFEQSKMQLIPSGLERDKINQTLYTFLDLIYHTKDSISIMTPYLVITDSLLDALVYASTKGIDIRIIIPSKNDHPLVNQATRANALKLIHKNIQVFLYPKNAFMHAKIMLIDQEELFLTSANFDNHSCKYNLELGVISKNKESIKIMRQQFDKKIQLSKPFTDQDCTTYDKLALFFSAIL